MLGKRKGGGGRDPSFSPSGVKRRVECGEEEMTYCAPSHFPWKKSVAGASSLFLFGEKEKARVGWL